MTQHPVFAPFNVTRWIDENQEFLKPPVSNKLLHTGGGMIVMVVGGPNTRVDFHDDPVEEWFFQQQGDMMLKIAEDGDIYDVIVREGEVFMVPPHTRHAPQRPQEGSIGIVVESPRQPGMMEGFECKSRVHRAEVSLEDPSAIVTALPKIYEEFPNRFEARTCPACGAVHPGKGKPPEGWVRL